MNFLPECGVGLSYEQTERQHQWQAAAAASPMQVYGDATHDAPNGSEIHFPSVILYTMDPMGSNLAAAAAARSVHTLRDLLTSNILTRFSRLSEKSLISRFNDTSYL